MDKQAPADRLLGLLNRELTRDDLRALPGDSLTKLRLLLDHWNNLAEVEEERRATTNTPQSAAACADPHLMRLRNLTGQ